MNEAVIGLSITYVALAALLLSIFLFTKIPSWIKLSCILLISSFYYLTFSSYLGLLGWPTNQKLPEDFLLLASSITEPDDSLGEPGVIFVWLSTFEDNFPANEPRAYKLPYDLELHASLDEALRQQRRGNVQLGRTVEKIESAVLPKNMNQFGQKRQKIEFYALPDPELPEK